jgi:hypothetical protein
MLNVLCNYLFPDGTWAKIRAHRTATLPEDHEGHSPDTLAAHAPP